MADAHAPASQLQLYFRCQNLADTDTFSKSDPYIIVDQFIDKGYGKGGWLEAGRTERIMNDLNPKFKKPVNVNFFFERKQTFRVRIFDDDGHKRDDENDKLGYVEFQLSKVVASRGHTAEFALQPRGKLFITAMEESTAGKDLVELGFAGRKLKKMDFFGQSDPYFKLSRILPNGTKKLLHQSKHIDETLEPKWPMIPRMRIGDLTAEDFHSKTLLFECFDKDMFSDDSMGEFRCSFNDLLVGSKDIRKGFALLDKKNKNYGEIYVTSCRIIHIPTFAEYLRGGFEINLACSIDFTGSNGNPTRPNSLHYMGAPGQPHVNEYVKAIMSVGDVLMQYDNDKQVPCFGFGAVLPNTRQTSHFFHVNFQPNPYVQGVQGILDAYGMCLPQLRFSGPTNFAETIRSVTKGSREAKGVYTVLLIITDGEITDMDKTINALVEADDAPLSIVIVGVGRDCDFEMMNCLDGDDAALRHTSGRVSRRDLVQFVPFRNFERAPPEALAAEVLAEIPQQFVEWARIARIDPPPYEQLQGEEEVAATHEDFDLGALRGSSWVEC